ncbi:hypothetical protein FQR65_LT12769 [Abscondita terminalis]|nr:hypothetical protein FQR65_LT12769 [Abscondita terminalis]
MPNDNGKESFKGEKEWDERNKGPGGGIVTHAKGARFDDHSDAARRVEERRRQSEQKKNEPVETNFTLQSRGGKDCIVVSFDKGMKDYQCSKYLYGIKRKIVGEFYGIKEGDTDEVVLNTAKLIFDVESFPFNNYKGSWSVGKHGGFEFVAPVDKGVIFNLKSHLAFSLKKDVQEYMSTYITSQPFDKKKYLWCGEFDNEELCQQFKSEFLSRMENRYGYRNIFKNPLEVKGNSVYIRDVFDDARFIDSVTRYVTWLEGMYLGVDSSTNHRVKLFKDMIVESIGESTGVTIYGFMCASPLNRKEASVLIPIMQNCRGARLLTKEEARDINRAFNYTVLNDLYGRTQAELSTNGSSEVYGIDFSNPEISYCVITKIMESSVINKDHELSIDPELHFQALSPAQSPVRVPNGPSSYFTESLSPTQEFPTRGHGEELGRSPRRGSGKGETGGLFLVLREEIGQASTSSQPMDHCSSPAPSAGPSLWQPSRPSSWKSANPVGTNPRAQPMNLWLSQSTSGNKWQPSPEPGPSGLSWKGANPVGTNPWSQPIGFWSSPAPSAGLWSLPQSGPSSSRGAGKNMLTGSSPWSVPPSTSSLTTRNDSISSSLGIFADPPEDTENICSMKEKQQVTKEKEEEKLSKALLYTLNLMNYTLDGVYTNFFAKDGKIVSLLHDNVDRKKYFQAVRAYIIEEYCGTEEEARKVYGLDEFPFKLNCEEKQGKTVVANISSGALSNLKILFSQKFGKNVDAIDISAVKKVEEREKDEWVDRQLKDSLEEACEGCFSDEEAIEEACQDCFPDEGAMKIIPIAFEGGEYVLDRSRDTCEVNLLFKEQLRRFRGTSLEKRKSSDKPLTEEEKNLFKELLYAFNYSNNNFDLPDTNFIVKNGKIASLIPDSVDVKEYLEEVKKKTKEEYCKDKKEAYGLDEFPFKLNCEEKQGKTVVANISSGALSNLKILFSQKFGKNVDAIDISAVKKVEEREKDEWVDRQLKDSLEEACEGCFSDEEAIEEACQDCFPDEGAMKIIPIAFEGGEYVLDRSRDTCEVNLLFKEQLRRFRGTSLEKRKSSDKPLTEEEKNLFKELLYAFNYSNNNFDLPDTNFIVKNGKIASLIPDSVDVKEYLEEVKKKTKEEYCKDKKEAYDLDEFPFEFLSNCEKNQETTVVANISRAALFNLEKLFIYGYEEKVKIEKIDINIIKEAVKSKKDRLIDLKVKKGIEREGGYYNRIKHREAATACYPDENALEGIPIIKDKGGYCLDRTFYNWETESLLEELGCTKGTSKAEEMKPEDNKDSGVSSENATSDYLTQSEPEPMDHEGSPPVQQQNPLSDDEGNSSESSRSGSSNSSSGSDEKNTRKRLQERKSPSPEDGSSPRKSPKRGSLPLSRLESLSLSSSSHQIGKC